MRTVSAFSRIWHRAKAICALLGKRTDGEGQSKKYLKNPAKSKKTPVSDLKDCPEFAVFMQQITKPLSGKTEVQKERIYLLPEGTKIERGIRYLRTGLYLGDQKKKRFEPSQALAMCLKAEDFKKSVSFKRDDERVIRYLKGETLDLSDTEGGKRKRLGTGLRGRLRAWLGQKRPAVP